MARRKTKERNKDEMMAIKKYAIEYSKRALEIENDKERMLAKNFNNMIIFNSILLIPLISVIIELCVRLEDVRTIVLIFGPILVGVVFVSLLLSMFGQNLDRHNYFKSISYLLDDFDSDNKAIDENSLIDKTIEDLDYIYKSKKYYNNKRSNILTASHIVIYSFYILLFVFGLVLMILL